MCQRCSPPPNKAARLEKACLFCRLDLPTVGGLAHAISPTGGVCAFFFCFLTAAKTPPRCQQLLLQHCLEAFFLAVTRYSPFFKHSLYVAPAFARSPILSLDTIFSLFARVTAHNSPVETTFLRLVDVFFDLARNEHIGRASCSLRQLDHGYFPCN